MGSDYPLVLIVVEPVIYGNNLGRCLLDGLIDPKQINVLLSAVTAHNAVYISVIDLIDEFRRAGMRRAERSVDGTFYRPADNIGIIVLCRLFAERCFYEIMLLISPFAVKKTVIYMAHLFQFKVGKQFLNISSVSIEMRYSLFGAFIFYYCVDVSMGQTGAGKCP